MAASSRRLSSLLSRSPFFPCVNSNVQDKDQVFGPGETISKLKDFDDVTQRAKKTRYCLAAGVLRRNIDTTQFSCMLSKVNKHPLGVNCFDAMIPFGGYNKMSGIGREKGIDGLDSYLEEKGVFKNVSQIVAYSPKEDSASPWYYTPRFPTGGTPWGYDIVAPTFTGITSAFLGLTFCMAPIAFIGGPLALKIPSISLLWMQLLGIPVLGFSLAYLLGTFDYIVARFKLQSWMQSLHTMHIFPYYVLFSYAPVAIPFLSALPKIAPFGLLGMLAFPVLVYLLATTDYILVKRDSVLRKKA